MPNLPTDAAPAGKQTWEFAASPDACAESGPSLSKAAVAARNHKLIAEWEALSDQEQQAYLRTHKFPPWVYGSSGEVNEYQLARFLGRLGSCKDSTWDRAAKRHTCCRSPMVWRHYAACPTAREIA